MTGSVRRRATYRCGVMVTGVSLVVAGAKEGRDAVPGWLIVAGSRPVTWDHSDWKRDHWASSAGSEAQGSTGEATGANGTSGPPVASAAIIAAPIAGRSGSLRTRYRRWVRSASNCGRARSSPKEPVRKSGSSPARGEGRADHQSIGEDDAAHDAVGQLLGCGARVHTQETGGGSFEPERSALGGDVGHEHRRVGGFPVPEPAGAADQLADPAVDPEQPGGRGEGDTAVRDPVHQPLLRTGRRAAAGPGSAGPAWTWCR